MIGVKDTKFQDRKGENNKAATLGDNSGRNHKGRLKKPGVSILTTKVVRVVTHGAKEHLCGVRILSPKVVKAATYGVKATRAKTLTTEVVKAVIYGARIVTAMVKAATNGVKEHQHGTRILATVGN